MFTRFIELVFGLFIGLYWLTSRFGVAGCVAAVRRADPQLLLAVGGAVVFLLCVLAVQAGFRWRKERERKQKEQARQERAAQRQKATLRAATPAMETPAPAPAPETPATAPEVAAAAAARFAGRTLPDLLDGLPDTDPALAPDTDPASAPDTDPASAPAPAPSLGWLGLAKRSFPI